jgi:peptidyl-prolyl cis-trans isomerase B (cyclophilin B)
MPALYHKKGALAAARTGDNVNPKRMSSGSQFYIVQGRTFQRPQLQQMAQRGGFTYTEEQLKTYETVGGTPHLDMQYTVFGEVIEGLEVVDKIAAVQTKPGDRPVTDITMKATLVK